MYKSSEKFSTAIEKNGGRTFHPKLIFDGFELETEIHSLSYNGGSNGEDNITIGSAVSATLEIKMDKVSHLLTKQNFSFNLGILCEDGSYEFIPMGKFNAEKPETTDYEINVTAYDNMVLAERTYNSQLTYPTTTTAVMKEICNAIGVSFATEIESITINNPSSEEGASNAAFAGYTMREAIGYIAGLYGKFAIFNRLGQLEFRWYEDSDYDVKLSKTYSFTKDEQDYSIDQLIVLQNQETTFKAGSGVNGISCSNPFATQSIVDAIYQKIGGFTFRKGTVKFLGDCRIDPWDIISVEDLFGNTYKIPAMSISHSVDGGLTTTIESFSNSNADVSDTFSGPVTKAMERTYAQLLIVNKLIADRVTADYVDANYVKTKELETVQATIENAVITNLQGKFASIEYLKANYATIESLSATIARVGTLETNSLTANSAVITQLTGGVANINTILFGSASGGSLSTEFSNSVVSLIGNAQIKSAMIESIDASKITALDINTTNVKVHSEDGKSQWKDNTIQISDNQRVRVQIGKDANADYNMYVWDKSGNLMFDAIGLTEKGINRPVIRNDMVKDDANISASKLDISSLFNVINNDGSHTLKSSKIFIDADNQTLDISFKSITEKTETAVSDLKNLTSSVATVQNTVNSQGTQITTIQGQISSKIWQQDITTAVSSVQIGGRNLCLNSAKHNFATSKTVGTVTTTLVADKDALSGYHTENKTTSATANFYSYPYKECQPGKTYTWSFWGKASVTKSGNIGCERGGQKAVSFTTEWQKYTHTFTANNSQYSAFTFYLGWKNGEILYIRDFKFEEGTKATTWTPAPEDIDADISSVEGKVTTLNTQYTSLSQTLTSLNATVNSHTTQISSKADNSTVTTINDKVTSLTADLSGFKTTVSDTYATKDSVSAVSTVATQTANKFNWLVKSGTSATDFTLTDRVATLLSDKFDITALTTFKTKAQNGTETVINGGAIKTGTITADKIKVDSLQAICAKIGGFDIDSNSIKSGTWGTGNSVLMCTGTASAKSIGGSGTISGWCFTAGSKFGVTKTGALYVSDITVNGGKIDLNASSVTNAETSDSAYFKTSYSSTCYARIASGKNASQIYLKNGKHEIVFSVQTDNTFFNVKDGSGNAIMSLGESGLLTAKFMQSFNSFACKTIEVQSTAHMSGTAYPQIYGNGTYLVLGYGNTQSLQLDSSKRFMPVADNSYTLGYSGYRWKQIYAAAGSISTSDRNAKKDITELDNQSYDFVMGLKPSKYRFIENESNRIHYGLIAQDVEILLGKLGIKTNDFAGFVKSPKIKVDEQTRKETIIYGEYEYGLRYEEFIAPIIKTIQMQDNKIKSLESLVAHLIGVEMNHS